MARRWAMALLLAVLAFGPAHAGEAGRLDKLLVGHLPVTGHAKLFVAKGEGFFADEGLDVELIGYSNSADGLAALRAGKLDVGAFGTVAPLVHIAAGADIRIIAGIMGEDAYVVARSENAAALRTPADLRGRRVATVRLASGDAVLRGALDQAGLSWRTDVGIVELSRPDLVMRAVASGQVDAGVIWGPHNLLAAREGLEVVFSTADLFPGHPCCRVVVRADSLAAKRAVWPRFLRAILRAERFVREPENKERVIEVIARRLPQDRDIIEQGFYRGRLDQASDPNATAVKRIWEGMVSSGVIRSDIDPLPYIVTDIYRQALDELMRDEPEELFWQGKAHEFEERNPSGAASGE